MISLSIVTTIKKYRLQFTLQSPLHGLCQKCNVNAVPPVESNETLQAVSAYLHAAIN